MVMQEDGAMDVAGTTKEVFTSYLDLTQKPDDNVVAYQRGYNFAKAIVTTISGHVDICRINPTDALVAARGDAEMSRDERRSFERGFLAAWKSSTSCLVNPTVL